MNDGDSQQLQQVAADVRDIKNAVLGNKSIGLPGLVEDVKDLKDWRAKIDVRVASIAGGVSATLVLAKVLYDVFR